MKGLFIMKKIVVFSVALLIIFSMAALPSSAKTTIKIGHVGAPISPQQQGGEVFAALVAYKSKGDLEIKLYHSATLGSEQQLQEGVKSGTVDGLIAGTWERFLPWAGVFQAPLIYRDFDHFTKVVTGPVGQELMMTVEQELNVKPLFILPHGSYRRPTNSVRPILKPADMKGLKIRDPNVPAYSIVTKAMGAVPVPMDFAELYMALSRKVVDGQHNPFSHIVGSKFYEVQKYVSLLPYGLPPHIVTLSKKAWGRLDSGQQEIIMAAAKEAALMVPALGLAQEKEYIELVKSKGMMVAEDKDIDLDAFLKIFNEVCVPQLKEAYGPKWVEAIVKVE